VNDSPSTAAVADLSTAEQVGGPQAARSELPITIISPHRGWFDWRLGQLWRYRDLITMFVWRDFVAVYKQTVLGPAWHLVRPLLATFTFTIVFSRMAGLSTDRMPPFLFYLAGYVLWSYFSTCVDSISKTFLSNSNLLGKVYFHRLVIPVSLVLSNLSALMIQVVLLVAVLTAYNLSGTHIQPTISWLVASPLLVLISAGYAFAVGIIVCAVTTRYRDLIHLITFGTQLLMYLTPVIYPVSSLSPRFKQLALLNPLTPIIEAWRIALLGVGTVTPEQVLLSGLGMIVLLTVGLMLFSHVERTFMDTV
jgi:lipopolysaccharide transport system permease protein